MNMNNPLFTGLKSVFGNKESGVLRKPFSRGLIAFSMVFSLVTLSGCSYLAPYKPALTQGNVMKPESVQLLQVGLTKQQVRELLGPPLGKNPFQPNHWEYAFYSTNEKLHQDSARHVVLNFDQDQMLKDWQVSESKVELKNDDSWLGLGWF
jgi:outer membrane protein assembly factor BamE